MSQLDLFTPSEAQDKPHSILLKDGELIYHPSFYKAAEADSIFNSLLKSIQWKQESMQMYGKHIPFPRLTAWYGDNDKPYSFSGITLKPLTWTPELLRIKKDIEPHAQILFNSVLLNRYRSGNDSISWHTDSEPELGKNPVIASVNFGETRRFMLRRMDDHQQKFDIELQHGSLLIMKGALQHYWQHQVPKTTKPMSERINLTFRFITF